MNRYEMQRYSRALGRPITNLVMSREASEAGHSSRFGKGADRLHQSLVPMGKPLLLLGARPAHI